jgi:exodeoxyribonuclease III
MKIVSYNVNGIRAAISKGLTGWLQQVNADVVCLQEIKATPDQIPLQDFEAIGYAYHYWYPAQKKGYSGVAILSKTAPDAVFYGTGIENMDHEGRNIRCDFKDLTVMSFYMPSGTNALRIPHKFQYMNDFSQYISALRLTRPNLVLCGDYNICHEAIDIHDPVRNVRVSGFLPEERAWLTSFMDSGFVDSFRHFNKEPHQYTWWSNFANARDNNKGWRLDYALVSAPLTAHMKSAAIFQEAKHSDHCPILLELNL